MSSPQTPWTQQLFEESLDGVLLTAPDGRVFAANTAAVHLLGLPVEDIRRLGRQGLADASDPRWRPALEERARTGRVSAQLRMRRGDGSTFEADVSSAVFVNEDGEPRTCVVFRDVTDRVRSAEALEASERLHRAVLASLPGTAVLVVDGDLRVGVAEGQGLADEGWDVETLQGHCLDEVLPPEVLSTVEPHWRAALAGNPQSFDSTSRRGRSYWTQIVPFRAGERAGPGALMVALDVTERVRLERAVREAEERFRTAFENAPIGMAIVGLDGRWQRVNAALCEITGYPPEELTGMTFQDITHPEDLDADLDQARALVAGRIRSYQMEKRYRKASGDVVWVMLSGSLVRDEAGDPLYFIAQVEDIDDRKRQELRLRYQAHHDPLTGLANRRRFDEEVERCRRSGDGALLVLDVDGLKLVNDRLGHDAGDQVLKEVARVIRSASRETDTAARIGGDEFGVVLPGAPLALAQGIAERIRSDVAVVAVRPGIGTGGLAVGVSVGVAGAAESDPVRIADRRMYEDKRRHYRRRAGDSASA